MRAEVLAAVLDQHVPKCSGPYAFPRGGRRCGPIFCVQCSEAAGEWVAWTPTHVGAALDAALAAQEGARPSVLPDLALRIEAMPGRGKSQTHLRKSDVLDLIAEVDRKWFAQTVARKGSALAAQEGDQGEAVREALDEAVKAVRAIEPPDHHTRAWWAKSAAVEAIREVRDRRAPEPGATP